MTGTATKSSFYLTHDFFGNPKYIKTSADGCEILAMVYPSCKLQRYTYPNPYPVDSGERFKSITKEEYTTAERTII